MYCIALEFIFSEIAVFFSLSEKGIIEQGHILVLALFQVLCTGRDNAKRETTTLCRVKYWGMGA